MSLSKVEERQQALDSFVAEFFPPKRTTRETGERPRQGTNVDDAALVERMMRDPLVRELMGGGLAHYGSQSESDAALCFKVIWWTDHDVDAAERIMRAHGPARPKWDTLRGDVTWLRQEIERANAEVEGGYAPRGGAGAFNAHEHRNGHHAPDEPTEPEEWEPPVPLMEHPKLPTFPVATLPGWLASQVLAVARHTQTPADMAAIIGLGVCAACVQKAVELVVDSDYTEPLNLYVLAIMHSGDTKSSVFRAMTEPLVEFEAAMAVLAQPEIADAEAERAFLQKQSEKMLNGAAKAKGAEQDAGLYDYKETQRRLKELVVPPVPRLLMDDVTPEKLGTVLAEQGGRGALISDEGGVWETFAGRYSSGVPNLDLLLKAHSRGTVRIDRVGRSEYIPNAALTIVQTAQPNVLQGIAKHPEMKERGVIPRLLFCIPKSYVGFRKRRSEDAPPVPADVRNTYRAMVRAMLVAGAACKPAAMKQPPRQLHLSPEAQRLREDFEEWREPQLAPGGELASLGGWSKKIVGQTCRIAGLLHLAEHAGDTAPWDRLVSGETMAKAIEVGKYLIEHAKAAYMEMGVAPAVTDARRITDWLVRAERTDMTRRDVLRFLKMNGDAVDAAIRLLVDHGWLRERPRPPREPGRPGAPSKPVYDFNPLGAAQIRQNPTISDKIPDPPPEGGFSSETVEAEAENAPPVFDKPYPCDQHPDGGGWTPDAGLTWLCAACCPPAFSAGRCPVCGADPAPGDDYCVAHSPALAEVEA